MRRIVIEPPRLRMVAFRVLQNGTKVVYKRLAFPWVVRAERSRTPNKRGYNFAQFVYVTKSMPTMDSPLYHFPLTAYENNSTWVHGLSHYGDGGRVCYGRLDPDTDPDTDPGVALWGSVHTIWPQGEVDAWEQLTKEHGLEANKVLTYRPMDLLPNLNYLKVWLVALKVGVNDIEEAK